jgi:hypothetical protein
VLLVIGLFKLVKASLLVAVAAGTLKFLNPVTAKALRHWAEASIAHGRLARATT